MRLIFNDLDMKNISGWVVYVSTLLLLFVAGCATTSNTGSKATVSSRGNVGNPTVSLADYLRKEGGITVQGSGSSARVLVRGVGSYNGNNQPLFVIDGNRVGRSFSQVVDMVDVNDIARIEVLKGNDASSRYGMAGSAGVIIIQTKRG